MCYISKVTVSIKSNVSNVDLMYTTVLIKSNSYILLNFLRYHSLHGIVRGR